MAHAHRRSLSPIGRIGRYELLGRLAVGGMAEIFLARETGPRASSREVVIKRILPQVAGNASFLDMFVQEARLCMHLHHPHICPIHEFGEEGGAFFLAMEWVNGVSLRQILGRSAKKGGIPIPIAVKIIADVASALHHAHTATDDIGHPLGIVHRDVTPENIMVSYDGVVKLLDFGVAKASIQLHQTSAGVLKGKFGYMSPEQYRNEEVDLRSDIFSLGVCLYECLTGQALYNRASEYQAVAAALVSEQPSVKAINPHVHSELEETVQKCLARDREQRFSSAESVMQRLSDLLVETRATVHTNHLADFVRRWFDDAIAQGPQLDRTIFVNNASPAAAAPAPMEITQRFDFEADLEKAEDHFSSAVRRKRLVVVIAALAVVIFGVVISANELRKSVHDPTHTEQR